MLISSESSIDEMRENLNSNNPCLQLSISTDKVEFFLDETGWDALELVSEAEVAIREMVKELYIEIS